MIIWNVDVETRNIFLPRSLCLKTISILPIYLLATLIKQQLHPRRITKLCSLRPAIQQPLRFLIHLLPQQT